MLEDKFYHQLLKCFNQQKDGLINKQIKLMSYLAK